MFQINHTEPIPPPGCLGLPTAWGEMARAGAEGQRAGQPADEGGSGDAGIWAYILKILEVMGR